MGSVHPYITAGGEKLYRIHYRRPDHRQTSERGFKTKRDAELRLAEVEISKARGEYVDPITAIVTIGTLGAQWLDERRGILKPSSFRPLESSWRKHVEPTWGSRRIGGIRRSEVQAWISSLDGGSTTVRRAHGVLAGILDGAVNDRRLSRNVARDIDLPARRHDARRNYLTHAQVQTLADQARYPTLILFLAYTGLRWGATALRVRISTRSSGA